MKNYSVAVCISLIFSAFGAQAQSFSVTLTNGSVSGTTASFEVSAPSATSVTNYSVEQTSDLSNWYSITNGASWPTNGFINVSSPITNALAAFRATVGTNESVNGLGFVTIILGTNWNMIAPQVNNQGGNDLDTMLTNLPSGTVAYKWDPASNGYIASTWRSGSWSRDFSVAPGEGMLINLAGTTSITNVFIGNLFEGTGTIDTYTNGTVVSVFWPQTGDITSGLGYTAQAGDIAYRMLTDGSGNYTEYTYASGSWHSSSLSPRVGEAFWYYPKTGTNWTKTLNIW